MTGIPVIFDLDGTLVDSAPDIHATANAVLADEGLPQLSFAQIRDMIGWGVAHLVGSLLEAVGEDPNGPRLAPMLARFQARYEGAVDLTVLFPGVIPALESLMASGHPLGICTNKPLAPAKAVLAHFGLTDHFMGVIGGDSLILRKPDPAPLRAAAALFGKDRVIFVGDSEIDAETARAAALPFVLFTEGYRRVSPEALTTAAQFSDYAELPALIAALTA